MEQLDSSLKSLTENTTQGKTGFKSFKLKRLVFLLAYLSAVPLFLLFLVLFSLYLKYDVNGYVSKQEHKPQYQALPIVNPDSAVKVQMSDARIMALEEFFAEYNSPLQGHAKLIVEQADKYKIDYRLLPAIAMQESTLCKKIIKDSYNCWGFGIYNKKVTRFSSYDDAIRVISKTLSHQYIAQGYVNISQIVQKYTPSDTGKWASVVSMMMTKLKNSL